MSETKVQANSQGKLYISNGRLLSSSSGGSSGVIDSLNVTPTTSAQTITASGGVDGYSPINVSAVTSSIDSNIAAENIKDGVTILGVTGNYQGGGVGGNLVYADNRLGRTPVAGEKVLLTTNTNTSISYSQAYGQTYLWQPTFVTPQGKAYNFNSYSSHAYPFWYSNGTWVTVDVAGISTGFDTRRSYININGVRTFVKVGSNNIYRIDYENNYATLINNGAFWPLNDDLKFKPADGKIYSIDETQSYDTGIGAFMDTNKNVQIFGNTVVVHNSTNIFFVDVTDFPNCTKTSYSLSVTNSISFGITGVDVGSYFIGVASNILYIDRFNGTGFNQVFVKPILNNGDVFVDLGQRIVCSVDTLFYPFGLLLDSTITEMQIPAAVRETCHTDVSTKFYNRERISFATNRVQSIYAWAYSTGDYNNYTRAANSVADGVWYISESQYTNFENVGSFTGFITGNLDSDGNYEVETMLPQIVNSKVYSNLEPDEVIVIGGAE